MDYQFWLPMLALVVGACGAYYQRKAVQLMLQQQAPKKASQFTLTPWWKSPSVIAMSIIAVLCWIPYFIRPSVEPTNEADDAEAVLGWGGRPGLDFDTVRVVANGDHLLKYRAKYKLIAACFFYDGSGDPKDSTNLQKSGIFDIKKGPIEVLIKMSPEFAAFARTHTGINYALLLIPDNVAPDSFSTIRRAQSLGARLIWGGGQG